MTELEQLGLGHIVNNISNTNNSSLNIPNGGASEIPASSGKFMPGSQARGAAKRNAMKSTQRPISKSSSGSIFANGFSTGPRYSSRPGGGRLDGRVYTPVSDPDPYNPGCSVGPVLSQFYQINVIQIRRQITQ